MPKIPMRKVYMVRFIGRILIMAAVFLLFFFAPECFSVLEPGQFFSSFSPLHLLWLVWIVHMAQQLLPARKYMALGSQKHQRRFFQQGDKPEAAPFRAFIKRSNHSAAKILVVWILFTLVIGALYFLGWLNQASLLLFCAVFYVCDLICVLFWCPFRVLFMKNRCCTTCRIFNWDHFMMFSPLVFIPGFYTYSLFGLSLVVLLVWELCFYFHPERFWERTNRSLRCSTCTDHLCGKKFE